MGDQHGRSEAFPTYRRRAEIQRRGTSWHEFVNEQDSSGFASGITYFQDSDFEWTLWYDEMMICIDPGQLLEVVVDGHAHTFAKGDSIWLPSGTIARYRSTGLALIYYAISPSDWVKRKP
ncbi:hypothetical protein [Mesorhizobium sp. M1312]|uniref:hypothetical protein n=1 Tax=unclassified Mesorhizobium TaxID=325217 RepID=UPI00333BD42C